MEISPLLLAKMLFVSFLFGIQAGIIFDACKALRGLFCCEFKCQKMQMLSSVNLPFSKRPLFKKAKAEKKRTRFLKYAFLFFCDFLWVVYCFVCLMIINYSYNDGGIRFFTVFGLIVGFFAYYFTLSRLIIFVFEFFSFGLKYTFFVIIDAVSFPFLKIYNNLMKKIKKRWENIRLHIEKKFKKVYNVSEEVYKNDKKTSIKISFRKNQKEGSAENENK